MLNSPLGLRPGDFVDSCRLPTLGGLASSLPEGAELPWPLSGGRWLPAPAQPNHWALIHKLVNASGSTVLLDKMQDSARFLCPHFSLLPQRSWGYGCFRFLKTSPNRHFSGANFLDAHLGFILVIIQAEGDHYTLRNK